MQLTSQKVSQQTLRAKEPRCVYKRGKLFWGTMAVGTHQLFLMAADLTLASVLFFGLYVLGSLFLASLFSLVIFHFFFGLLKKAKRKAKRKISLKVGAVLSLVSRSTIGGMLVKKLDRGGSGLLEMHRSSEGERTPMLKKERSSNIRVTQLPAGMSGVVKNPSVKFQEDEAETPYEYERILSPKRKNCILTPVKIACPCLKRRCSLRRVCACVWKKTTRIVPGLSEKSEEKMAKSACCGHHLRAVHFYYYYNYFAAVIIALLWAPVTVVFPYLKNRSPQMLTSLSKSQE